jgi:hypothetical protein
MTRTPVQKLNHTRRNAEADLRAAEKAGDQKETARLRNFIEFVKRGLRSYGAPG